MANHPLYFLDFYSSNEAEPNNTLEIAVLCWDPGPSRPKVYLHSLLRPEVPERVSWTSALDRGGIKRSMIADRDDLPTFSEVVNADFLKNKHVVCLNPGSLPAKLMCRNAASVYGIMPRWKELFLDEPDSVRLAQPSQMLMHINLPPQNTSRNMFTALLCRLYSLVAIWYYMAVNSKDHNLYDPNLGSWLWPLPDKEELAYPANPRSLKDFSPELWQAFFSEDLPFYLDWYQISLFSHDFRLRTRPRIEIVKLDNAVAIANRIFFQVLPLMVQLLTLVYYALCTGKRSYALHVAMCDHGLDEISAPEREDFAQFIILHLPDLLSPRDQEQELKLLVQQHMQNKSREPFVQFNFDEQYKRKRRHPDSAFTFKTKNVADTSRVCLKEIYSDDTLVFRSYEMKGSRRECIEAFNEVYAQIQEFWREALNPLSQYWVNRKLQGLIYFITGFSWKELTEVPRPGESQALIDCRKMVSRIIDNANRPYLDNLDHCLSEAVKGVNDSLYNGDDFNYSFCFQGISVQLTLQIRSFSPLRRLLHLN